MGIFDWLKSKKDVIPPVVEKPLWETDFEKFAETAESHDLDEYEKTIDVANGREIDLTHPVYGHSFTHMRKLGNFVNYGTGCYGSILGSQKIKNGDILLLKASNMRIAKFLVLKVTYERDPADMFWAYIVCTGYKD